MSIDDRTLRVFVYGTLKRGQRNHARYCGGLVAAEPARVWGRLFHLPQGYPILDVPPQSILALGSADGRQDATRQSLARPSPATFDHAAWQLVAGELLTFDDPALRLAALDRLEGYYPERPSDYWRVLVELAEPAGVIAWIYVAPDGRVPSGAAACGPTWPK